MSCHLINMSIDVPYACRYSGADLAGLVREAAMTVLRRVSATPSDGTPLTVTAADFEVALTRMKPSVSREDEEEFEGMYAAKSWSKLSGPK